MITPFFTQMEAILSKSLRESRLAVLLYRPLRGSREDMDAVDFLFHQSMDMIETTGEPVHWIREEPLSKLPSMAIIPHPTALTLLKLHYADDRMAECLAHVLSETEKTKDEDSFVIEFGSTPRCRDLAAVLATLQSPGANALVVLPYTSSRAHVASMYTDVLWSFDEETDFKKLTCWDEEWISDEL